jgi:hypothetical protein
VTLKSRKGPTKPISSNPIFHGFPEDWDDLSEAERMKVAEQMAEAMQAALLSELHNR